MLACIITAGGFGKRFNSQIPKQYHKLESGFVLQKTIDLFCNFTQNILVVIRKEDEDFFKANFKTNYCFGGQERQNSVFNGLEFLCEKKPKYVLITDGVRPFASKNLIQNVINALEDGEKAVIPCVKVQDTVKKVINGYVSGTISRENLALVQTPQGFDFNLIHSLHKKYQHLTLTDDSALCEIEKIPVKVIEGERGNIKITTQDDLRNLYIP